MKRSLIIFVLAGLVLITLVIWIVNAQFSWNIQEILMVGISFILVGFAFYIGINRVRSSMRKEPPEDELSKRVMTKATSLSYFISIYLWLFIMYISDKVQMEAHTLIGAGILGMAVIFLISWIVVKLIGLKNG
jgi:peptidoglycan/LPS O-acetylase OafA/YrhL